jgi:simple sugar transport system permease protein
MVILSGWRPALAAVCCIAIAVGEAVNIHLQVAGVGIPHELAQLAPYILTLVVLVIAGGKHGRPPRSLGRI